MPSFQISITPSRREAARFVTRVRRALQKALAERGLTQSDIAREIGVHRSVINREFRGYKDITLGRVAELSFAMGRRPAFDLPDAPKRPGQNTHPKGSSGSSAQVSTTSETAEIIEPARAQAA